MENAALVAAASRSRYNSFPSSAFLGRNLIPKHLMCLMKSQLSQPGIKSLLIGSSLSQGENSFVLKEAGVSPGRAVSSRLRWAVMFSLLIAISAVPWV
jgi:hypothetical protein